MANSASDTSAARKTYAAVLTALETATRWQKQQADQALTDHETAIHAAETAQRAEQAQAQKQLQEGTTQATKLRDAVEEIVTKGDRLYGNANLGKNKPALPALQPRLMPQQVPAQMLEQFQDQATQAFDTLEHELKELERARVANMLQRRNVIIAAAVLIAILVVVVGVLMVGQ